MLPTLTVASSFKPSTWLHRTWPLLASSLCCAGACVYHDDHPHGSYVVVPEVEPNNAAFEAQFVGFLDPYESVLIQGSVAGVNGFGPDGLDGFAFASPGGVLVQFSLVSADPLGDVDVCLYDPYLDNYVACWQSSSSNESGEFYLNNYGADYQLVVIAANAASAYELYVSAEPLYYATKEVGQNLSAPAASLALQLGPALLRYRGAVPESSATDDGDSVRVLGRLIKSTGADRLEPFLVLDRNGYTWLMPLADWNPVTKGESR